MGVFPLQTALFNHSLSGGWIFLPPNGDEVEFVVKKSDTFLVVFTKINANFCDILERKRGAGCTTKKCRISPLKSSKMSEPLMPKRKAWWGCCVVFCEMMKAVFVTVQYWGRNCSIPSVRLLNFWALKVQLLRPQYWILSKWRWNYRTKSFQKEDFYSRIIRNLC